MTRYIVVLLVTAAVGFTVMLPWRSLTHGDVSRVARMATKPGRIVVLGDSVIDGYSHCDTNTASIPAMLAGDVLEPVVDGSRPGSTLGGSLEALRVAARGRKFSVAVMQVTVNGGLFRSVGPVSETARLWKDFVSGLRYAPSAPRTRTWFKGRAYGGYEENAALYFRREKAASGCPENAGVDLPFVEYMQWLSFGQRLDVSDGFANFVAHARWLRKRGITTLAVLPPVNHELIERLNDAAVMANLRAVVAGTQRALQSEGIPTLDLTFALPAASFADQWCACGHLNEHGRQEFARRVAERVKPLLEGRPD